MRFHAVKDVNLDIRDKEFMVFVGPSGCGKNPRHSGWWRGSNRLRRGGFLIDDKVINELGADGSRHIAMVFQKLRALSAYERLRQHGVRLEDAEIRPAPTIAKRVREAADILGIQELLQRKPRAACRAAQRQRVAPRTRDRAAPAGVPVRRARCRTSTPSCVCRCVLN